MMKLSKYIKNKLELTVGILLKLFEAMIEIMLPIGMSLLIENGIMKNNKNYILFSTSILLLFVLIAYGCSVYAQYIAYDISESYAKNVRSALYEKISALSPTQFNEFPAATLTNRLTLDVYQSSNGISMSIRIAARAPFLMIGSLIAVYIINGLLAFILLVGMIILLPILYFLLKKSMKLFGKTQSKNDELTKKVKNDLIGMRMIRAFNGQLKEEKSFDKTNKDISHSLNKLSIYQLISSPLTTIFMYLTMVIMLYIAVPYVKSQSISVTKLSTLVTYSTQLITALVSVMNLVMIYTRSISSNHRIKEIMNIAVKVTLDTEISMPETIESIQFVETSYTYPRRSKPSVNHINLDIKKGEIIGLTGKTGSGKSTIMQMLAGFFKANYGFIKINNVDIDRYKLVEIKEKIGYVSQKASFLKGTVYENITMGNKKITEDKVIEALKKSEAYEFIMKKGGIHATVEEKGSNFSGGQRQRLALARAFAHNYDVLILDDSFSALDYLTESKIRTHIVNDYKDKILVLISVRKSTLLVAERIYLIEKGMIEVEGTHDELITKSELYNMLVEG